MTAQPPPPLEWHPWYRDKTWLIEWLKSDDYTIRIPVPTMPAAWFRTLGEEPTTVSDQQVVMLTKQEAHGPAPYVGRPFAYTWTVATDQYGRSIAGEACMVYRAGWL